MNTIQLIEHARRRPEFVGGVPLVLNDGQTWYFARPKIRVDTIVTPGGPHAFPSFDFDAERIDPNLGVAFAEAARMFHQFEQGSADQFEVIHRLIGICLYRNYDMTRDEILSLVTPEPGGGIEDNIRFVAMTTAILEATIIPATHAWLAAYRAAAHCTPSSN